VKEMEIIEMARVMAIVCGFIALVLIILIFWEDGKKNGKSVK